MTKVNNFIESPEKGLATGLELHAVILDIILTGQKLTALIFKAVGLSRLANQANEELLKAFELVLLERQTGKPVEVRKPKMKVHAFAV